MTNNDWEQPGLNPNPQQGGAQPPHSQQLPQTAQPARPAQPSASAFLTEGWGAGQAISFGEFKARFRLVFERSKGSILKAWVALGLLPLIFAILGGVLSILGYYIPVIAFVGGIGTVILRLFLLPLTVVLGIAQMTLLRPLYARIFEDPREQMGVLDTIKSVKGVFVATLLVSIIVMVGSGLGLLFCILPGIVIAFMLSQSLYLAAGQGLGPIEAVTRSFELNKTHFMSVLMIVGALFCMAIIGAAIITPVALVSAMIAPFGGLLSGVINWGVMQVFSFVAFLLQATVFSAIESKETGRMPV